MLGAQADETAEAFGEYQTTEADGTRGDPFTEGRSTASTEVTPKSRDVYKSIVEEVMKRPTKSSRYIAKELTEKV